MISQTSYEAFKMIKDKLGPKQKIIYSKFMIYGNMTNEEMAELLGWKEKSVTPRTGELLKIVDEVTKKPILLEVKGRKLSSSGRPCSIIGVVESNRQIEMFRG